MFHKEHKEQFSIRKADCIEDRFYIISLRKNTGSDRKENLQEYYKELGTRLAWKHIRKHKVKTAL